jgi:molybdopterin/thiamine biosynthesis adenylyltransferase
MTLKYSDLTSRNLGYIDSGSQTQISQARILIAGCGIGSQAAETAARVGFQHFVLVDGDTVDSHNLNRQFFFADQVGKNKAEALKENILRINPQAQIEVCAEMISEKNASTLVAKIDVVLDTIDFLDLKGIVALHDEAHRQKKVLVSSFSVGFGAAVMNFPANDRDHSWIRDIFDLPRQGDIGSISYVQRYQKLFESIAPGLDSKVLEVMAKVLKELADGRTCPAPQVAPGANMVASMCVTSIIRLLSGEPVVQGPKIVILNLLESLQSQGFQLD